MRAFIRPARDTAWLALLLVAALLVAGCSAPWGSASAPAPTPSPTPAPVQVALALAQAGKVADGTLALTATVTVTNHLAESISLTSFCGGSPPYIRLDLFVPPSTLRQWSNASATHNPFCSLRDMAVIAPGGAQSWTVPVSISKVPAKDVVPGAAWHVVTYVQWHTGPLPTDVVEQEKILHEPGAQAQITLT